MADRFARAAAFVAAALSVGVGCKSSSSGPGAAPMDGSVPVGNPDSSVPPTSDGSVDAIAPGDDASDGTTAVVYDLASGFSSTTNPNGPWRWGYSVGTTLTLADFRVDPFAVRAAPGVFWHPGDVADGGAYYPYVAQNTGTATAPDTSGQWAARGGEVALEGSNDGHYAIVQFVAPSAGAYQVTATFEGLHTHLSSTDVHVKKNDEPDLFQSNIQGYGGDPSYFPVQGSNPSATYQGTIALQAGDVVTFAVGYGPNGTNYNDTTGLIASLTATP